MYRNKSLRKIPYLLFVGPGRDFMIAKDHPLFDASRPKRTVKDLGKIGYFPAKENELRLFERMMKEAKK